MTTNDLYELFTNADGVTLTEMVDFISGTLAEMRRALLLGHAIEYGTPDQAAEAQALLRQDIAQELKTRREAGQNITL